MYFGSSGWKNKIANWCWCLTPLSVADGARSITGLLGWVAVTVTSMSSWPIYNSCMGSEMKLLEWSVVPQNTPP